MVLFPLPLLSKPSLLSPLPLLLKFDSTFSGFSLMWDPACEPVLKIHRGWAAPPFRPYCGPPKPLISAVNCPGCPCAPQEPLLVLPGSPPPGCSQPQCFPWFSPTWTPVSCWLVVISQPHVFGTLCRLPMQET